MSPKVIVAAVAAVAVALLSATGAAALSQHRSADRLGLDTAHQVEFIEPGTCQFGNALAISGDTVLVGDQDYSVGPAVKSGAVYVYVCTAGRSWHELAELNVMDTQQYLMLGRSVGISDDHLVVSSDYHRRVAAIFAGLQVSCHDTAAGTLVG